MDQHQGCNVAAAEGAVGVPEEAAGAAGGARLPPPCGRCWAGRLLAATSACRQVAGGECGVRALSLMLHCVRNLAMPSMGGADVWGVESGTE